METQSGTVTQLLLPLPPPPLLSHSQLVIKFFTCFVMTLRFLPSFLPSLHCHHSNLGPWGFIPGIVWATLLCFLSYQFMLHSLSLSHWAWRYLNLSSSHITSRGNLAKLLYVLESFAISKMKLIIIEIRKCWLVLPCSRQCLGNGRHNLIQL